MMSSFTYNIIPECEGAAIGGFPLFFTPRNPYRVLGDSLIRGVKKDER